MTQAQLDRELADVTGESVDEIRRRGFSLIEMPERPQIVDWDQVQQREPLRYRPRRRPVRRPVAA